MRKPNDSLSKVFKQADRTGDLQAAWRAHGEPTTFKNVQRAGTPRPLSALAAPAQRPRSLSHRSLTRCRFEDDEDGWAVGCITEPLTNKSDTVEVLDDDDFSMYYPKNFRVAYDLDHEERDSIDHYLDYEMYADSCDAPPGSWVLLAKESGKSAGKRAVSAADAATAKVAKMDDAELQALYAAIKARRGGDSDSE